MNRFEFPRISRGLAVSLADSLSAGQSVAVLGGRYVGKRYLLRQVYRLLCERGREVRVATFRAEDDAMDQAMSARFLHGIPSLMLSPEEVALWWRDNRGAVTPANLLVANFDNL